MATGAYVLYTREFTGGQIGVFVDRSRNYLDKSGAVNGGAIKFANLKLRQNSPTSKLDKTCQSEFKISIVPSVSPFKERVWTTNI